MDNGDLEKNGDSTLKLESFSATAMDAPPSWQTAGLSRGDSTQFLDQEATSRLEGEETDPLSTEWTDEKHSLYLNSMEASFVNQLYDSSNLLGWPPRKWNPSESQPSSQKDCNTCISSGQFKVLRGGSWQKMECVRAENKRHDDLQSDPWIRHFRSSRRGQDPGLPFLQENAASTSKAVKQKGKQAVSCGGDSTSRQFLLWNSLYHRDSVGSNIEVSGQNFMDDEIEGSPKRMKTRGD